MAWDRPTLSAALFAVALSGASCSAPSARIYAGYFSGELSGGASLSAPTILAGTVRADVQDDLGLDENSASLHVRAELDAGPVRLTGSALRFDQKGHGRLSADFGGISAGADVDTDVDLGNLKGALTFDVLDLGAFRLSPGVGVDLFDLDAAVTERSTGMREQIDELLPVPMVFVQAEATLGPLGVIADFGGMDAQFDAYGGRFLDFEGLVRAEPFEHVEFFVGYRWISMDASGKSGDQDFDADLVLRGWFAGGGLRF